MQQYVFKTLVLIIDENSEFPPSYVSSGLVHYTNLHLNIN